MLLQHLKRRATQIDLPLILGTTNMYTDWYLPSRDEAIDALSNGVTLINEGQQDAGHENIRGYGRNYITTSTELNSTRHSAIQWDASLGASIDKGPNTNGYTKPVRKVFRTDLVVDTLAEGGLVGYVDTVNGYSLIWGLTLANSDGNVPYSNGTEVSYWSNIVDSLAGATSTADGLANSLAIVNQVGHTNSRAQVALNHITRMYLPVNNDNSQYKLDIDWGDGIKRRYEGAGSDLFDDSFTYTEAAFPDVGVFNADVPTDYTTWIDFFDPAGGARFPTVNGNTLTETLSNLYQAAAKKFIYDKTYKFTTVSLNVKKEVATNDEVFGFRIQKDSTVNNDDIYGDATISKEDGTIYSQSGWEELTVVDNGSSLTINGTVMANTNTSSLVILPAIGFTYSPLTFVATGSITINSIELKAYTQPDIKIWARNGADNNLNFNRTSWLTHGDTLIQEGDMSKEPLDISIDANQNGIPDDWE
jgi:hypothetical protein